MTPCFSDQYDHKALKKYLLLAISTLVAYKLSNGLLAAIIIPVCVAIALMKGKAVDLLFWVLIMTYSSAGNHLIFCTNTITVLVVRVTLIILAVLTMGKLGGVRNARAMSPFWGIVAYLIWEAVSSCQGFQPVISFLKLGLFVIVFLALFGVANTVNASTRTNAKALRSAILSIVILVIFGSVLLIPFPSISLMTAKADLEKMLSGEVTSLFCGLTSHSQVMGPMAGILGTLIFADLVFSIKKFDWLYIALLLSCPILVFKSSSRTGMGVLIAGMGLIIFLTARARGLGERWKGRVISAIFMIGLLCVVAAVSAPSVRSGAVKFIMKWGGDDARDVTVENVMKTRQGKIDVALDNFKNRPIFGNGFQVSEEMVTMKFNGIQDYLSAPIEKGVWIYAVLEEGGVVGWILFTGWLCMLFPLLVKRHAYVGCAVMFAVIVANLGEFSMFSTTYIGGIYWAMTFAAVCLDVQRMKGQQIQVFEVPIPVVMEEVGMDAWTKRLA